MCIACVPGQNLTITSIKILSLPQAQALGGVSGSQPRGLVVNGDPRNSSEFWEEGPRKRPLLNKKPNPTSKTRAAGFATTTLLSQSSGFLG